MKMWDGYVREEGSLRSFVDAPRNSEFQVMRELWESLFSLADEEMVGLRQLFRAGRDIRAADNTLAQRLAQSNHAFERIFLHDHCAREDDVGPLDVGRLQLADVHVHEPPLPLSGQERRDGQETERREGRAFAFERERVTETPVRVREFRVNQQRLHHTSLLWSNGPTRLSMAA